MFGISKEAYEWVIKNGPSDESRKVASKSPHEVTWKGVQTWDPMMQWDAGYVSAVGTPNTPLDPK